MVLPVSFCWTRYGTEAGETTESIFARKEAERRRNGGIFLWGIGNALGPSLRLLLRETNSPEVLFSPISSPPRIQDVRPEQLVRWHRGRTLDGRLMDLPEGSVVTSGARFHGRLRKRFALVCSSSTSVRPHEVGSLSVGALTNLATGHRLGASQVTAIVRFDRNLRNTGRSYAVALRARLVEPFLLELADPELLESALGLPLFQQVA